MDGNLAVLCVLTGVINLIGALAYGARIAGVRTRRIAMSFALFNILVLVSRLSNGFLDRCWPSGWKTASRRATGGTWPAISTG